MAEERRIVDARIAHKLTVLVFSDTEPKIKPRIAYLFGQTESNEKSVLVRAHELYKRLEGMIFLAMMGGGPLIGDKGDVCYPGGDSWSIILRKIGVPHENMFFIDPQKPKSNSFTEAQELVRLAKEQGWPNLYIIAPTHHQVRCFISTATVALQEYPELKIYNQVGTTLDWNEEAIHSQGALKGKRHTFIDSEWDRIEKYMNLVSPAEALAYLENRDK